MTIPVPLDKATEENLRKKADSMHIEPGDLAASIIRGALRDQGVLSRLVEPAPREEDIAAKVARLDEAFLELENLSRRLNLPSLPDETFSRENIYQDHD